MVSHRTSRKARALMGQTPGLRYQQALARVRSKVASSPTYSDWFNSLGIDDVASFDPRPTWASNESDPRVQLVLGHDVDDPEAVVSVDMTGGRSRGRGSGGLIQGITGTGKSTFLGSLVLGLSARYSPSDVNFVLIDTQGEVTFRGLDQLPQVIGNYSIGNFSDGFLDAVDRVSECVVGEIERRLNLMQDEGVDDVVEYRAKRSIDPDRQPAMPELFIVMNEVREFIYQARPEFEHFLTHVARVGSSVGVHLFISDQYLGRRTLETSVQHLAFRICMKVRANTSRLVLGVDDAVRLPVGSGDALLRTDSSSALVRFRTFDVSAQPPSERPGGPSQRESLLRRLSGYTVGDLGDRTLAAALSEIPCGRRRKDDHVPAPPRQ